MKDGKTGKLTDDLRLGLRWLVDHFKEAGPRVITGARNRAPVIVFSDGACEEAGTTVGAVVFDPESEAESF